MDCVSLVCILLDFSVDILLYVAEDFEAVLTIALD